MEHTVIETFVGCGGAHLGLKRAGFKSVFINDIQNEMIETIKLNDSITEKDYYVGDIKDVTKELILEKTKLDTINLDLLVGGIVCKGFSLAGMRNPSDDRNYLYKEQLRLVSELRPKVSLIENVPQLKTTKIIKKTKENEETIKKLKDLYKLKGSNNGKKTAQNTAELVKEYNSINNDIKELEKTLSINLYSVFDEIIETYNKLGYTTYSEILTCADYGDFTSRRRLFIVAIRDDIHKEHGNFSFPKKTNSKNEKDCLPAWKTVFECFKTIDYLDLNSTNNDVDNRPMKHADITKRRFMCIKQGHSIKDTVFPDDLKPKSQSFSSRGTTKRLDGNKCAPTLVPGHSAFPIHPTEHHSITIREGACLTGFPSNYKFYGSHTKRCEQIGNAIPVNMAYNLGLSIKQYLSINKD
jgi:DNA (cytosine-5)-methyltransferase 1